MILIDSNVLIDLTDPAGRWWEWSRGRLAAAAQPLIINAVVLAEFSIRFAELATVLRFLRALEVEILELGEAAAFRAGQAHRAYRKAGGEREAILADFLIGAHAAVLGASFITRDRERFASYFPELKIITPEEENG